MRNKHDAERARKRAERAAARRLRSKTDPDNWPLQEVSTLDDILADRSVSMNMMMKESIHASDR